MLSDYTVWLIDDDVPVTQLPDFPRRDQVLNGTRPIDHGLVCQLVNEVEEQEWGDHDVFELCKHLVGSTDNLNVFLNPGSALGYLKQNRVPPDIIVYDLEYQGSTQDVDDILCNILERSFTLVQVYTTDAAEQAQRKLAKSFSRFPKRLTSPRTKDDCNPSDLALSITNSMAQSFPANMAKVIRGSTSEAIERALINLDELTPFDAIRALLGTILDPKKEEDFEPLNELDLVGLMGTKIADELSNNRDFVARLDEYTKQILQRDDLPEEVSEKAKGELLELVISSIKAYIEQDKNFFRLVEDVSSKAAKHQPDVASLTRFTHFRLYSHPTDKIVRTGDIISFKSDQEETTESPDLGLVLTPPCDLARFWVKTRGCLTLAILKPIKNGTAGELKEHNARAAFSAIANMKAVSQGPVLFPALILSDTGCTDYVLFSHQIKSYILRNDNVLGGKQTLTYTMLDKVKPDGVKSISQVARLSEPFLTGILDHIKGIIFRTGLPDIPLSEIERVNNLLK